MRTDSESKEDLPSKMNGLNQVGEPGGLESHVSASQVPYERS